MYRHEDLFEDALTHAPDATGRVQARNGAVYHARLSLPPSPAPRVVPAPERSQPRAVAPAPAAVSLDAAALDALGRSVHLMDAGVSILLQGETGAGKEVFARQMHARSRRAAGPFVAVNCAALPESLIESELFGYEDGAFTGARRQGSKGLLRQAHGGVLFLDEIGDMPLALQSRLLRVLQEREVSPLGGARPVPVDFALLCATHRPLAHEGADAPVRPDLYFRIAEYTVTLLRERTDLRELLRTLWNAQGAATALPPVVERALASYAWPGNYRQLVSVLRTLRVLAGPSGVAGLSMLPEEIQRGALMRRGMRRASQASPPSLQVWQTRPSARRWPRMAAMSAVRRVCWACTAARCTGAWRRWKRPGPNGRRLPGPGPLEIRGRGSADQPRQFRARIGRAHASPTRKASTLCWRIS